MAGTKNPGKALTAGAMRMSKRILISYVIDWILIIGIAAAGGAFNRAVTHTHNRPFNLSDPSISYPYREDTVSIGVAVVVALVVPAIITAIVSLIFIPGPTASKTTPKALIWRRKLWEWNTSWMGLALSCASAFMITEGFKDMAGKPRPYAISKCRPDLANIDLYRVGGLGTGLANTGAVPIMVSSAICQERDPHVLREIFASWPSGHSSFAWSGLLYLTLFLCSKFAVYFPYSSASNAAQNTYDYDNSLRHPQRSAATGRVPSPSSSTTQHDGLATSSNAPPPRNTTAAPPIYLLLLAVFLPIGTACFICISRWFDFHHHGIDIFTGAFIGAFTAYFSFRFYHMPIRRGSGWSWGARSRGRAFWVGVGRDGYVGEEGWVGHKAALATKNDIEAGTSAAHGKNVAGAGMHDSGDVGGMHGAQSGLGAGRYDTAQNDAGYTIRNSST